MDICYVNIVFKVPSLGTDNGKYATLSGKVREKEYDSAGKLKYVVVGNTICYVNKIDDINPSYNGTVKVMGKISDIEPPMNPGGFDGRTYYVPKKIYRSLFAETAQVIGTPSFSIREYALKFRRKWAERVNRNCIFEGGTVNTLLLGDKSDLSEERKDLYSSAGVAHFLVISGLHISAIGTCVYTLLKRTGLKRPAACGVALLFLVLYGLVTGFTVSVTRAVIMFSVRLFSDIVKRVYDMLNAVAFSVIIALIMNPLCILDTAFIYSYMTVFAIAFYVSYLHPKAYRRKGILRLLRESFRIPVVLFMFLLPVSLCVSNRYSMLSVPLNTIIAPLSAPILATGFAAFVFSVTGLGGPARIMDFLLHLLLRFLDMLCSFATGMNAFTLSGKPSVLKVVVYYVFLVFYFVYLKENTAVTLRTAWLLSAFLFTGSVILYRPEISMLYVGQGECIVIRTSATGAVMIDCGSTDKSDIAKYSVYPFLYAKGIKTINAVFVTHTDTDHCSGVIEMFDTFKHNGIEIKRLLLPDIPEGYRNENYGILCRSAAENGISVNKMSKGDSASFGGFTIGCLYPSKKDITGEMNDDSLVLSANFGGFDILFTGDISSKTEEKLEKTINGGEFEVLKVPHHGSKTATSESFLDAFSFENAIISAGRNNVYNHPSEVVTKRLESYKIPWLCTKECGNIDIRISVFGGKSYTMVPFCR